jgi:hypothetical protein
MAVLLIVAWSKKAARISAVNYLNVAAIVRLPILTVSYSNRNAVR